MTSTLELPKQVVPEAVHDVVSDAVSSTVPGAVSRAQLLLDALKHPENHRQAFRFLCVGASGFIVNQLAFMLYLNVFGIQHTVAFWAASLTGTANNFWWNRNWTFDATHHHIAKQGVRFLVVSLMIMGLAYLFYLGLLPLLGSTGIDKELSNGVAWILATPISFILQKLWSFKA